MSRITCYGRKNLPESQRREGLQTRRMQPEAAATQLVAACIAELMDQFESHKGPDYAVQPSEQAASGLAGGLAHLSLD